MSIRKNTTRFGLPFQCLGLLCIHLCLTFSLHAQYPSAPGLEYRTLEDALVSGGEQPTISNGWLVSYPADLSNKESVQLFLTKLSDRSHASITLQFAGAKGIRIAAALVIAADKIGVFGRYISKDLISQRFYAVVGMDGVVQSVTDLGDFAAAQACTTRDGTLWAIGMEPKKEGQILIDKESASTADYPLIRQLSSNGAVLASFLKRSSLSLEKGRALHLLSAAHVFLDCSGDNVAAYLGILSQPLLWRYPSTSSLSCGADKTCVNPILTPETLNITGMSIGNDASISASVTQDDDSTALIRLNLDARGVGAWTYENSSRIGPPPAGFNPYLSIGSYDGRSVLWAEHSTPTSTVLIALLRPTTVSTPSQSSDIPAGSLGSANAVPQVEDIVRRFAKDIDSHLAKLSLKCAEVHCSAATSALGSELTHWQELDRTDKRTWATDQAAYNSMWWGVQTIRDLLSTKSELAVDARQEVSAPRLIRVVTQASCKKGCKQGRERMDRDCDDTYNEYPGCHLNGLSCSAYYQCLADADAARTRCDKFCDKKYPNPNACYVSLIGYNPRRRRVSI